MIRRLVQLVLDRDAAKRLEKETQGALDRGTKPGRAQKNLTVVERTMGSLRRMALKLGVALGAALAVRKIQQFGKEAIRVAAEAGAIWNRLAGQLRVAGVEFGNVEGEIRSAARAMQDMTTVGDEDFARVMTELLSTTNDYAASLAEVETVANLAAAKQIDLRTAAQLVGRAMVGQTGTLSRYGIIVAEGADAMEVLRARFAGMAQNEGKTFEGMTKRLNNEWADFKQAVGEAMIAAGGGTSVLETLIGTVKGLTAWVDQNQSSLATWGSVVLTSMVAVGKSAAGVVQLVRSTAEVITDAIVLLVRATQLHFAKFVDGIATDFNRMVDALNHLPFVDIDFRMGGMDVAHFEAMRDASLENLKTNLGGVADALVMVGDGWVDMGGKALAALGGAGAAPEMGGGGGAQPAGGASVGASLEELNARLRDIRVGEIDPMTGALVTLDEKLARSFERTRVDRWNAAVEAGRQIVEETRTATEIYAERMAHLDSLLAQGAILEETYARAADAAADALDRQTEAQNGLNDALGKARGLLGSLSSVTGAFGFAIPGLGPLSSLLGGGLSFAGLFAHGGDIPAGSFGIAGERGPEIVTGPATVTPMPKFEVNVAAGSTPGWWWRDQDWLRGLAESQRELGANGFRAD